MKTIKNIIYLLIGSLALNACSGFLDQEPKTAEPEEVVLSNINNIENLISGQFINFKEVKKGRGSWIFTFGSDETKGGKRQLIENFQYQALDSYDGLSATNERLSEEWSNRWPVITSAAKTINALQKFLDYEDDKDRAKRLIGESSFIRAALMMELTTFWGAIPIIDVARTDELGYRRQPVKDVWTYIIEDLKTASKYLPDTQDSKIRSTSGAALALLGKAYMSAPVETGLRDFNKARESFELMMGRYQLLPNVSDLWDADQANSVEAIYEFQFRKGWPEASHFMNDIGSGAAANAWGMACYFAGWDMVLPTQYAYAKVSEGGIWEDGDLRRDESIRYNFDYKGQTTPPYPGGTGDELDPHIKKHEDIRTEGGNSWESGKHLTFLRLGDIILCYAECLNELGETSDAVDLVNDKIRARAWGGTLPAVNKWSGVSQDDFRIMILDERMRELCFEGWRRQDLIRTGKFVEYVKARNATVIKHGAMKDYHALYPIPDTEIKVNEYMTEEDQNPGY